MGFNSGFKGLKYTPVWNVFKKFCSKGTQKITVYGNGERVHARKVSGEMELYLHSFVISSLGGGKRRTSSPDSFNPWKKGRVPVE